MPYKRTSTHYEGPFEGSGEAGGQDEIENYARQGLADLANNPMVYKDSAGRFKRIQPSDDTESGFEDVDVTEQTLQDLNMFNKVRNRNAQRLSQANAGQLDMQQYEMLGSAFRQLSMAQSQPQQRGYGGGMVGPQGGSLELPNAPLTSGFDPDWLQKRISAGSAEGETLGGGGGSGGGKKKKPEDDDSMFGKFNSGGGQSAGGYSGGGPAGGWSGGGFSAGGMA